MSICGAFRGLGYIARDLWGAVLAIAGRRTDIPREDRNK